jgi:Na+/melibiose symporter-like transporter
VPADPRPNPPVGPDAATVLPAGERLRLLVQAGAILLLLSLASPAGGLIGIPVVFFLKNRLHLSANATAQFNLWVSIPLYLSFAFGLLRDRWSPFGAGDKGHLILFGAASAVLFGAIAFLEPTYAVLMIGLLLVTSTVLVALSAANGIFTAMGQAHLMPGQSSAVMLISTWIPVIAGYLLGGVLSQTLEGLNGGAAARALFLVAAGLMIGAAVLGGFGPKALFTAHDEARSHTLRGDIARLLRHWPVYPATILMLIWNFQPAFGTAMTYHLANHLKASDSQVGTVFALYWAGSMVMALVYSLVCQKVRLSKLLWWSTIVAIPSMAPLLLVATPSGAMAAALVMGLMSGFYSAALIDLAIRSAPRGLEATLMMLILMTTYYVSGRFGDLWGTYLFDREGGITIVVVVTIALYFALPLVTLLVPKPLIATADGEAAA